MPTLSRTAEKCRKCPKVKTCNNKLLEACALAELPKTVTITVPAMQPMVRDTSLQAQMEEQLKNNFYKGIFNSCNLR